MYNVGHKDPDAYTSISIHLYTPTPLYPYIYTRLHLYIHTSIHHVRPPINGRDIVHMNEPTHKKPTTGDTVLYPNF